MAGPSSTTLRKRRTATAGRGAAEVTPPAADEGASGFLQERFGNQNILSALRGGGGAIGDSITAALANQAGGQASNDPLSSNASAQGMMNRSGVGEGEGPALDETLARASRLLGIGSPQLNLGSSGRSAARSAGGRGLARSGGIFLDEGSFDPTTADGRGLVGHEAAHLRQAQLAPAPGPWGGAFAEAEASSFGARFASGSNPAQPQFGLPAGHVAAEGGGASLPSVDVLPEAVLAEYRRIVESDLGLLMGEPAFQELAAALAPAADEGTSDPDTGASESDTGASESQPSQEEPGTSQDPEALLDEVKGSASFLFVVDDYGKTLVESSNAMMPDLQAEFDEAVLGLDAVDGELEALDQSTMAAMELADQTAVCEDVASIEAAIKGWPADPMVMFPELIEVLECSTEPEQDEVSEEPALEEPQESVPEPEEQAAPVTSTVSDTPPVGGSVEQMNVASEEAEGIDAHLALCSTFANTAGSDGAGLYLDRLPAIGSTMLSAGLEPFFTGMVSQFGDTLVLDTLGTLGDAKIAEKLSKVAMFKGNPKVPIVGPAITLLMKVPAIYNAATQGDWTLAFEEEFKDYNEAATDFGEAKVAMSAALNAEGWDAVYHGTDAVGEVFSGLSNTAGLVAALSGLLSALLFVGAFALGFCSGGTAVAVSAGMVVAAKFLAEVATVAGIVCLWARGVSLLFASINAALAPVDEWGDALIEVEAESAEFGEKAGGFAGDMAGQAAAAQVVARGQNWADERKPPDPVEAAPAAGDSQAQGEAAAAAKATREETAQRRVDEALDKMPGFKRNPESGEVQFSLRTLVRDVSQLNSFLGGVTDAYNIAGSAVSRLVGRAATVQGAPSDLAGVSRLAGEVAAGKADIDSVNAQITEARSKLDVVVASVREHHVAMIGKDGMAMPMPKAQYEAAIADLRTLQTSIDQSSATLASARAQNDTLTRQRDDMIAAVKEAELVARSEAVGEAGGSSSGNSTGGVGSAYKALIEAIIEAFSGVDEAEGQLSPTERAVADCEAMIATMLSAPESDSCATGEEDIDITAFLAAPAPDGGGNLDEDLSEALAVRDEAVVLTTAPATDPTTIAESVEGAAGAEYDFYQAYCVGFALGGAEAMLEDAVLRHASAEEVEDLALTADGIEAKVEEKLEANAAVGTSMQESGQPSTPMPGGAAAAMTDGMSKLATVRDYVSGADEVGSPPSADINETIDGATRDLATVGTTLAAQRETLTQQRENISVVSQDLTFAAGGIRADATAMETSVSDASALKESSLSTADSSLAEADGQAATAVEGLTELAAWRVTVAAASDPVAP